MTIYTHLKIFLRKEHILFTMFLLKKAFLVRYLHIFKLYNFNNKCYVPSPKISVEFQVGGKILVKRLCRRTDSRSFDEGEF